MARVLVVETDQIVAHKIDKATAEYRERLHQTSDPTDALALVSSDNWTMLVFGDRLSENIRTSLVERARNNNPWVQIAVVANTVDETDWVSHLSAGADDYIAFPISTELLAARLNAMTRRHERFARHSNANTPETPYTADDKLGQQAVMHGTDVVVGSMTDTVPATRCLTFGELRVDITARRVWANEQAVALTHTEFNILEHIVSSDGMIASKKSLLTDVLGFGPDANARSLHSHVNRIRKKLERANVQNARIATIWKYGYRLQMGSS